MSPAVLAVGALALVGARLLWWAIATGHLDRGGDDLPRAGGDPADDAEGSGLDHPALAGFVLSGSDGRVCRVLDTTGPATVAHLVASGTLDVVTLGPEHDDVELAVALRDLPAGLASGTECRVLDHLRRCGSPVTTSALRRRPPSSRWWAATRRSIAAEAVAAGLARPTTTAWAVLPSAAIGGLVVGGGAVHLAGVAAAAEATLVTPVWAILGLVAARVTVDALRTAVERPHRLTRRGRVAATLLAHRHDELARAHDTGSGLGTSTSHREAAELAMATALGVPTRLTRQVPLPGADSGPAPRHRVVWSRDTDGVRPIRVVTPLLPGRGGRPTSVMASGVGLLVAAVVLRSGLGEVDDAAIIARLRGTTPEAVGSIDQVLDVARLVALAPLLLGIVLAVAGTVDLRARRVTVGRVVDVRLPGDRSVGDRAARALSGTRTSGTLIVEMAVDDGTTDRVRSWRVDAGTAAPVGSMVEVRHTPVLGRVVSVRPAMGSGDPVVETVGAGRS